MLRHFTFDAKFGAIMRYDFNRDKGQKITYCRIDPNISEMLIGVGQIVGGIGFDSDNCNGGIVFRVPDSEALFAEQVRFGLHMPIVYGDYQEQLAELAKRLGLKVVIA